VSERHSVVPAVWVFFKNEKGEILLIRRHNTGWRDGWYTVPAGHVEAFESPTDCAIRESKEEVDLTLTRNDLALSHTTYYIADEKDHERVSFFFTASSYEGVPKNNEPNKADELIWVSLDDLPEKVLPMIKHVINKIKAGEAYSELEYSGMDKLSWETP
jgi:8-oxo-dGTP diphosphatase